MQGQNRDLAGRGAIAEAGSPVKHGGFENTPQCCIKKKKLKLPLLELWLVGARGLGGRAVSQCFKGKSESKAGLYNVSCSIHTLQLWLICAVGAARTNYSWANLSLGALLLTAGQAVLRWAEQVCAFPGRLCWEVCAEPCEQLQFSQCSDRICGAQWWIGWSGFMSWFLGPGNCRAKWGQEPDFHFQLWLSDYPLCFLCFYVMVLGLCSQGRALLNSLPAGPVWSG